MRGSHFLLMCVKFLTQNKYFISKNIFYRNPAIEWYTRKDVD